MIPLSESIWFPNPSMATPQGFLAFGGDLSVQRLLLAYNSGIFPWYSDGDPIMWWSPDPRMVLYPKKFKVSKSLRRTLKKGKFEVTINERFSEVIKNCAEIKRKDGYGTWITPEIQAAYIRLHELGPCHVHGSMGARYSCGWIVWSRFARKKNILW